MPTLPSEVPVTRNVPSGENVTAVHSGDVDRTSTLTKCGMDGVSMDHKCTVFDGEAAQDGDPDQSLGISKFTRSDSYLHQFHSKLHDTLQFAS